MKIALPSSQDQVDEHFGHCEYFTVFTIDDQNKIQSQETITPPAGCGCKSNIASILAGMGVKYMLAGNMGQGAVNVLGMSGIQVLRGCSGNVKDVAENWLAGNVRDNGLACAQHEHGCHEH
ncbi:MAG: NifB/NifX family molybdenum-iron cluster-binding protein [Deltaproteobacteria bacterium]